MIVDVPIIMYHSVGTVDHRWPWHFLTTPWQTFEDHLAFLQARGYRSVTLAEFHAFKTGEGNLPAKPVVFTFDDGYLDNWVFAAPLLQRYGFRGTIFVNPDFVDPSEACRPTLEDCRADRAREADLPGLGFLSWAEMRAMERSGVMDIQSHAMTHTWYPCGPKVVDFRHPGDGFFWMGWNAAPERKWDYLPDGARLPARYGEPVYEHRKSLAGPRYLPDPGLADHLVAAVAAAGAGFFERPDWRAELQREAASYRRTTPRPSGRKPRTSSLHASTRSWAGRSGSSRRSSTSASSSCAGPEAGTVQRRCRSRAGTTKRQRSRPPTRDFRVSTRVATSGSSESVFRASRRARGTSIPAGGTSITGSARPREVGSTAWCAEL